MRNTRTSWVMRENAHRNQEKIHSSQRLQHDNYLRIGIQVTGGIKHQAEKVLLTMTTSFLPQILLDDQRIHHSRCLARPHLSLHLGSWYSRAGLPSHLLTEKCHLFSVILKSSLRTGVLSCSNTSENTDCRTNHFTCSSVVCRLARSCYIPLTLNGCCRWTHSHQILPSHRIQTPMMLQKICARDERCSSCGGCRHSSKNFGRDHETHQQFWLWLPHHRQRETSRHFVQGISMIWD